MLKKLFKLRGDSWKTFGEIKTDLSHCVTFGIPIPSASIGSWKHTCTMLELTLTSILSQTDPRFRIIIVGHDKPAFGIMQDERIQFVQSCSSIPIDNKGYKKDTDHKRDLILKKHCENGAGYYMPLDADDLIHKDLVKYVLSDDNKLGYCIKAGYALDWQNKRLAPVPGAWNAAFDSVCGSCAVFYLQSSDMMDDKDPSKYTKPAIFHTSHGYWRVAAQEWGKPLSDIPFPACIYIVNHSQNLSYSIQRKKDIRQKNIIENIKLHQIHNIESILSEFSVSVSQF
jgi:hypothetical protein